MMYSWFLGTLVYGLLQTTLSASAGELPSAAGSQRDQTVPIHVESVHYSVADRC